MSTTTRRFWRLERLSNLTLSSYAGGLIYGICGDVACSTTSRANSVAVWNGSDWSPLGLGLSGYVKALAVDQDSNVYVGGNLVAFCGNDACTTLGSSVNHIARWTPGGGGAWSQVGNGLDANVDALVVDRNNTLYAGGFFTHICGTPGCTGNTQVASGIAQWNGSWSAVGNGLHGGWLNALAVDERNNLYAGGLFQFLCGDPGCNSDGAIVHNLARWDGNAWSALGNGIGPSLGYIGPLPSSYVSSLACSNGALTVGGFFSTAGDKSAANFARYLYGVDIFLPMVMR
jgi:trimeric autotransporter adhesin